MEKFVKLIATAVPFDRLNVNTDEIFPARFMRKSPEPGYQGFVFHDLRFDDDGKERPEFILNNDRYRKARILVGNTNFGCGSSREGAVYALQDYGFAAAIAPSFGDIFASNCLKNGFLPIQLPADVCDGLRRELTEANAPVITVDLENQEVSAPSGDRYSFDIDPFQKHCILKGLGEITLTLKEEDKIAAFESQYREDFPWLFD